jgi:hypothetical protein
MIKRLTLALLCATLAPAALAASPWDGTWKMDKSKSHLTGNTFMYSKTASGMWKFSDGAGYAYDFAADGKSYPLPTTGDSQVASMEGDHVLVYTIKHGDTVLSTTRETLSADGKILTDHSSGTRADGTKFDDTAVSNRVSGGPGFLGTWKSIKNDETPDAGMVLAVSGDHIQWDILSRKESVNGKMDGSDVAITGPNASANIALSLKKPSPNRIDYWVKLNGKELAMGHMTLAPDGKTLTDVSWTTGKESEKTTAIYIKQ